MQTPMKLDPEDRHKVQQLQYIYYILHTILSTSSNYPIDQGSIYTRICSEYLLLVWLSKIHLLFLPNITVDWLRI